MLERLLCGENYSSDLAGENTLCEERYFAEMLYENSDGDTIVELRLGGLRNSAGDRNTSPRTIFPWQLAEDNPVISSGEE